MKDNVMITGGTGYLGSWIVRELLENGYAVRLTTRNKGNKEKTAPLERIAKETPGTLDIYEADLLAQGTYEEAAKGSKYIIHSASPFRLNVDDVQKELIAPALQGTENVLQAASASETVEKVILTSSIAAVHGDNIDMREQEVEEFTEEHFNTTSTPSHQPYSYSKVVAEKKAWEIHDAQHQWKLVVLNPAFVMGPPIGYYTNSESIHIMQDLLRGKYRHGAPDLMFGFVDVRDVAKAHLMALEDPKAHGRYLLAERVIGIYDFAQIIKSQFGKKYKLPSVKAPKFFISLLAPSFDISRKFVSRNVGHSLKINSSKSREQLGLSYTPLEKTVKDMVERMEDLKMV